MLARHCLDSGLSPSGEQRSRVKTLQDRPKLYSAKPKTVAWLMGLTRPKPAPKDRSNFERHIYSVEAAVTDVLQEADKDLHVVLEDGPAHMVAESPNAPFCSVDATAYRKKQMAKARDKVKVCAHARIVGVVFWDRPHNVTGRAPNSIELHPDPRLRLFFRLRRGLRPRLVAGRCTRDLAAAVAATVFARRDVTA